jgi:hypothetical protein
MLAQSPSLLGVGDGGRLVLGLTLWTGQEDVVGLQGEV